MVDVDVDPGTFQQQQDGQINRVANLQLSAGTWLFGAEKSSQNFLDASCQKRQAGRNLLALEVFKVGGACVRLAKLSGPWQTPRRTVGTHAELPVLAAHFDGWDSAIFFWISRAGFEHAKTTGNQWASRLESKTVTNCRGALSKVGRSVLFSLLYCIPVLQRRSRFIHRTW